MKVGRGVQGFTAKAEELNDGESLFCGETVARLL